MSEFKKEPVQIEINLVKLVSRLTPWLAPFPSAFFVARASMKHLALPLAVAIIVAAIIEALGLTSVHTWLMLTDWNTRKRKSDPSAPTSYSLALAGIYFAATIGLTIMLEVQPDLAAYAPAIFPCLAMVGAFNLVLISQQEQREALVRIERETRRAERSAGWSAPQTFPPLSDRLAGWSVDLPDRLQGTADHPLPETPPDPLTVIPERSAPRPVSRENALTALVAFYQTHPGASYSTAARAVGRSKSWVVQAVRELVQAERLHKRGQRVEK